MNSIEDIIQVYSSMVKGVDKDALEQQTRAYGGVIRSTKGRLQEYISEEIVKIAWQNIGAKANRLEINSNKIKIPIKDSYIENIANKQVRAYILEHKKDYYYGLSVDKHIFVDNQLVMGIECKAYTENAMLKRILVDFHLLKTLYPNISCYLFQLESQLGGDYSALPETLLGSKPTHSIMSYFESVNLNIVTLLKGERDINQPIHKIFKPLDEQILIKTIKLMENELKVYL